MYIFYLNCLVWDSMWSWGGLKENWLKHYCSQKHTGRLKYYSLAIRYCLDFLTMYLFFSLWTTFFNSFRCLCKALQITLCVAFAFWGYSRLIWCFRTIFKHLSIYVIFDLFSGQVQLPRNYMFEYFGCWFYERVKCKLSSEFKKWPM